MLASGNRFKKGMFGVGVLLLALFILFSCLFLALQGGLGRDKIASLFTEALQDSGWKAHLEKIQGSLFEELALTNITLESPEGDLLTIGKIETRLSLWRLLKREIAFNTFYAKEINWLRTENKFAHEREESETPGIPFTLLVNHFHLEEVHLPFAPPEALADLQGSMEIGKNNSTAYLTLYAKRTDVDGSFGKVVFRMKPGKMTQLRIDLRAPTFALFAPWLFVPAEGSGNLHLFAQGPWSSFSALLFGGSTESSLHGFLRASIDVDKAEYPFLQREWQLFSAIERSANQNTRFSNMMIKSQGEQLTGQFAIDAKGSLLSADLQGSMDQPRAGFGMPFDGKLSAGWRLSDRSHTELTLSSPEISYQGVEVQGLRVDVTADKKEDGNWSGEGKAAGLFLNREWSARAELRAENTTLLHLDKISLASPFLQIEGDLALAKDSVLGELHLQAQQLRDLTLPLYGNLTADVRWTEEGAEIDATGKELYYQNALVEEAHLFANLKDQATLHLQRIYWESLAIDSLVLDTVQQSCNWPFSLQMEGDWKGPLELNAEGFWSWANGDFLFDLQDLTGFLFFHPVALKAPAQLEIARDLLRLSDLEIDIGNASLFAQYERKGNETEGRLLLDRFPIDFLSINPLELSVIGTVDLSAEVYEKGRKTSGSLTATINDVEIATLADQNPLSGTLTLNARLADQRLALTSDLSARGKHLLHAAADLPLQLTLTPLSAHLLPAQKAQGDLSFDGPIEEFLDFFDLGPNRLEGRFTCNFHLANTLLRPLLSGSARLENGVYENYASGMQLQEIQAELVADNQSLFLRSLTARDGQKKGRFSLNGEVKMLLEERFPFRFDGEFARLNVAQTEWLAAEAGGKIQIVGNADSARATGQAAILETDMSIPERIPRTLPDLQVQYINAPKPVPIAEATKPPAKGYPLFLDLHIYAPNGVFVSGRGLNSEWKGDFQLGGTYTDLEARGQLELIVGEFLFSGKGFKLTDGTLTFTGRPHEMPLLNIAARMNLQSIAVIARLQGPLDAPQLSFQSIPPLPLGAILSYLLFGEDLSKISAVQAAQLVNSITTLADEASPGVLENTRRTLGVDRLRIVAAPTTDEGAPKMALQVGKYVTRGVLISVSQGTQGDSTNLAVEIDLVNGFVFQAESQQEQEQGKFTVKWNLNY